MEILKREGGYTVLRLSPEELEDLPKVGLGEPRPLPPEIVAKLQRSLEKRAAQQNSSVVESREPVVRAS